MFRSIFGEDKSEGSSAVQIVFRCADNRLGDRVGIKVGIECGAGSAEMWFTVSENVEIVLIVLGVYARIVQDNSVLKFVG